jgi:transcriptional regulator with XRE-family HTH domain
VDIADFARKLGVDRSHLSRIENGALAISRQTDRLVRTLILLHHPILMEKLTTLDIREEVLKRLEETKAEAATVTVELRQTSEGYSFELAQAA